MTTPSAQSIYLQARDDIQKLGFITYRTERVLNSIGYDTYAVSALERRLKNERASVE